MNDGKTIVWRVYSKTPFWDVIQPRIVRDYFYEGRVFGNGDYLFRKQATAAAFFCMIQLRGW